MSVAVSLTACGTPAPQDYGGKWMPVNRFLDAPAEIPLSPSYVFYATPKDETLRTMLERWATDAGLKLSYRLGSDFTLYKPVARIHTTDIQAAASELSAVYFAQGVSVLADSGQILVRSTSETRTDPGPDAQAAMTTGTCRSVAARRKSRSSAVPRVRNARKRRFDSTSQTAAFSNWPSPRD